MNYLSRFLAFSIQRALKTFPAVLVTGARQSGKTTLLREEFGKTHRYVSFERPDTRERALADPVSFLLENPAPVIFDEIQYATGILPYVKDLIDQDRKPGQWFLTGSQKFQLMNRISESLAGRVAVLELDPLSVGEFNGSKAPASTEELIKRIFSEEFAEFPANPPRVDLGDWLLRGGYPEIRLNPEVDRELWFSSYVQTYLERDVRDLVQVADLGVFNRFLRLIAARTGTILNTSEIGKELGVTAPTVKRWLSVLETSQIIYLLPPYHKNFGKRIRKNPKVYFLDPSLAAFLTGLHNREAILNGPSFGALMETAVISEWIKTSRQMGEKVDFYYWRSGNIEVDLVIERDGRLYGLEIKATATPTLRHADSLAHWLSLAGKDARGALACSISRPAALRPGIRAVPWHLAW